MKKIKIFELLMKKGNKPKKLYSVINFALLFVLISSIAANQMLIISVKEVLGISNDVIKSITQKIGVKKTGDKAAAPENAELTSDLAKDAVNLVISKGTPKIYGEELSVSFDKVQQSMNIMGQFDPTYGSKKIVLTGGDLSRYIDIGLKIACEYCCGATGLVQKNGDAACGCAHSQAMRGLSAYLIKNHGDEYSNDEILRELARWKGMFFPKQMIKKLAEQIQSGKFTPDISALVFGVKLPDYGQGDKSAPLPSEIENLPGMVGGC